MTWQWWNEHSTWWWKLQHEQHSGRPQFAMKHKLVEMQWRERAAETYEINEECGGNEQKFNFLKKSSVLGAVFHYFCPFLLIPSFNSFICWSSNKFESRTEAAFSNLNAGSASFNKLSTFVETFICFKIYKVFKI